MASSWQSLRVRSAESAEILIDLLRTDGQERRLIVGYLETKRLLAEAFQALARERYYNPDPLNDVKNVIQHRIRTQWPHLPQKYSVVKGYGEVHVLILSYLVTRLGVEVPAEELRLLTGDAVHTERRARDLRSLGFALEARESGGRSVYVLPDPRPDAIAGALQVASKNIADDPRLDVAEKQRLLASLTGDG